MENRQEHSRKQDAGAGREQQASSPGPEPEKKKAQQGQGPHLLSDELIRLRSEAAFGSDYRFLRRNPLERNEGLFECLLHGTEFIQGLHSHFAGRRPLSCPGCKRMSIEATSSAPRTPRTGHAHIHAIPDETVREGCRQRFGDRLTFLRRDPEKFKNGIFRCIHGKEMSYPVYHNRLGIFPAGCPACRRETRKTRALPDAGVRARSFEKFDGRVYFLRRDPQRRGYGMFHCQEHGVRFVQTLGKHFAGQNGCVLCRGGDSRLERAVYAELLRQLPGIEILREHKIPGCRNRHELRFDFFIPALNLAVEADGEPHFTSVAAWGGEEGLALRQSNDRTKNGFTEKNGISLARVSFFEADSIADIVAEALDDARRGTYRRIHDFKIPGNGKE